MFREPGVESTSSGRSEPNGEPEPPRVRTTEVESVEQPPPAAEVVKTIEQPPPAAEAVESVKRPPPATEVVESLEQPPPAAEAAESVKRPPPATEVVESLEQPPPVVDLTTSDEEATLPAKPPMNHSDTKDSLSSVDSFQLKDEDNAHHADLSDSASDDVCTRKQLKLEPKPELEETEFVPPDDELAQKIVDQVEFYFSDVNITKDAFLLKHVKRNKEGYVSLKLISSFKRVKHLAKDWRVVAYSLAKSTKLEINEAGTKLRRVDPLPAYDQTTPSRTVVAVDLPLDKPTIENVAEMFKSCGEIALIRILRPGNPIPADVRHFVNKHPEMIGKISALVEFVRTESAHNAIQKEWNWRQEENMRVIELNAPPSVDKKKKSKRLTSSGGRSFDLVDHSSSCQSGSEAGEDRRLRLSRRCSSPQLSHEPHWFQRRWSRDSGTDSSSSYSRSRSNSGVYYMPEHGRRISTDSSCDSYGGGRSRSGSGISLSDIRRLSIASKDSDCCCCHVDCTRRGSFGKDSGSEGYGSSRSRCNSGASDVRRHSMEFYCAAKARERRYPDQTFYSDSGRRVEHNKSSRVGGENVVRMPRGPDGGRGFAPSAPLCHTLIE